MKLNAQGLSQSRLWQDAGYDLPRFDRLAVMAHTKEAPFWIHFGAGNIFRAFPAHVVQNLLNEGVLDKGLIVAEGFDYEIIEKINRPHDDYSILVTLRADGRTDRTVIGSVLESLTLDSLNVPEYERLKEIFAAPSLQMATFTITEKGYSLVDGKGSWLPAVENDFAAGTVTPQSYMGKVAALLYHRFMSGQRPVAMVSMDNCSRNGDKLYAAIREFAVQWCERGLTEKEFLNYVDDRSKVSFPWTMIDKITPRPDACVQAALEADGVESISPVVTAKNTYIAPFVNAEVCEYLVIEDCFPNGRPQLESGGLIFTDRETVSQVEKMKVCTCLNPLHTSLAIFGCLLGYQKIADEMKDVRLKRLAEMIGYDEGLPVAVNPGILDPKQFLDTVLNVRIPNPFMPDTPARIATDTSQKLAIRFGETIKAYAASPSLDVRQLKMIPLVFAGWLRYLMAVDDAGNAFELSPDPLLGVVCPYVKDLSLLAPVDAEAVKVVTAPLLKMENIFGVDLYETGLADSVCAYLAEMLDGPGAVGRTLEKYTEVAR